ncbi:MAG: helix-turn-helix transcriptional regulator [Methylotenera sp.]|jgi:LuxR family quorum-sensing transcriptional regulator LasR|nr:MAG: helix-turn-helix transcriptional regulator [Methylotenera sp.]
MRTETSQDIPVRLSPKEIECLNWAMEGKSSWEIGVILGRKENTVNYHIANIMGKLHVSTRQQAVIKALRLGLIQL